jgi:hypothetical protein
MKRTQLYLTEDIWKTLHIRSRQRKTAVSELVRKAIGEKYGRSPADRREAMQALVGLWKERMELPETEVYARQLRKGKRLRGIAC